MKKKDLIFYAGTAVLLAFSTQQVKADEQHASDQTPENTSAIVATTTSSEAQNTVSEGVGAEKGIQTENTVATEATPVTPTLSNNQSSDKGTSDKVVSEQPAPAVVASRAPYGARARVVESEDNSLPVEKVEKPSGTLTIENNNVETGTFDAVIRNVVAPNGLKEVLVPTWSDKNWQDDLVWHKAVRQSDGSYRATIKASDHKNEDGKYHIHLYYIQNDGSRIGVGGTTTEIEFRNAQIKTQTGIKNVNSGAGTYTVTVDQAPQGRQIKKISVAVWSESNQSNLYWYDAIPTNAHTEVNVSTINHKNLVGNYTTHVYVNYVDGGVEGFNLGQTALHPRATVDQTAFSPRVTNGQRDRVLRAAASLVGVRGGTVAHHQLVNDYNSVRPLPVGYAVKDSDDWCDVFVTTIFQREGLSGLIGRECGVERHIQIFKRLGIWNENGASTPKAGDIITFNWDQDSQPNNGFADHIGIVESVSNGIIHTIEGNSGNQVRRNTYRIGHGNIRGFATPRYQ